MMIDAICVVQGPGDIGFYQKEGILYIYSKDKIHDVPKDGLIYTIEEGYNRFWLGEEDAVRKQVAALSPIEVEVEL